MNRQPIHRLLLFALSTAVLTGCAATMTVGSHVEPAAGFSSYQTFAWDAPDALPAGDPRLTTNIFFRDHVEGAVEKQLAMRGLRQVTALPDLRIHYHANIQARFEVGLDHQYAASSGSAEPQLAEFEQGTLVVDVMDARTSRLVWRGWAQDAIDAADSDRLHHQIDEAVPMMFRQFPRQTRPVVITPTER
jgi:Domain of unknown function (DUF4136)